MNTTTLETFTIKMELCSLGCEPPTFIVSVYAMDGGYIGSLDKTTLYLLVEKGVVPQKSEPSHKVCSIGKSLKDGKWYGWSHRAIHGFSIGDEVREGDCCATSGLIEEYLKDHPKENRSLPVGFVAKTDDDCKRMAIAFADSVA